MLQVKVWCIDCHHPRKVLFAVVLHEVAGTCLHTAARISQTVTLHGLRLMLLLCEGQHKHTHGLPVPHTPQHKPLATTLRPLSLAEASKRCRA